MPLPTATTSLAEECDHVSAAARLPVDGRGRAGLVGMSRAGLVGMSRAGLVGMSRAERGR